MSKSQEHLKKEMRKLREASMSRKKSLMQQAIPNDPIQQAKQKMLELAAKRRKLQSAAPAQPNPPKPSPAPTPLKERQDREVWDEIERVARTLVGDAAVDAEYLKEEAPTQAETWQKKTSSRERVEAKVGKLEEMHRGVASPTYPLPDHPPLILLQADRPSTPKDALGPEPGIVRQILLATAEWPTSFNIDKSSISHYDERVVRYCQGEDGDQLFFWLANGCAVYDVEQNAAGTEIRGSLLRGKVFPLLPTAPKE